MKIQSGINSKDIKSNLSKEPKIDNLGIKGAESPGPKLVNLKENFPDLVNKIDQKWSEVNDRMENNIRSLSPENKKLFLLQRDVGDLNGQMNIASKIIEASGSILKTVQSQN